MTDPAEFEVAPPTRWEQQVVGERWTFYAERFDTMTADGTDLDGEARFVDAMAARGAAVLDAGCGTGRVAAALHARGHEVVGVDRDAGLIEIATARYPGVRYLACDLLLLTAQRSEKAGGPASFDIIALPGNVMVYLAPGTERRVLTVLAALLRPAGRIVAGLATDREYTPAQMQTDVEAIGLTVEHRFSTWQMDRWTESSNWVVLVIRAPGPADTVDDVWQPATEWPRGAK